MIPPSVIATLGISIGEFAAWAADASSLRAALKIASETGKATGTFFRFVNAYVNANEGATRKRATQAYRAAKAWAAQGAAISTYHRADPIDPRLAREIPAQPDKGHDVGTFRSWVEIDVTDPDTGKSRTYSVYIDTFGATTLDEVYDFASYHLVDFLMRSPPATGKNDINEYEVDFRIMDFARYA